MKNKKERKKNEYLQLMCLVRCLSHRIRAAPRRAAHHFVVKRKIKWRYALLLDVWRQIIIVFVVVERARARHASIYVRSPSFVRIGIWGSYHRRRRRRRTAFSVACVTTTNDNNNNNSSVRFVVVRFLRKWKNGIFILAANRKWRREKKWKKLCVLILCVVRLSHSHLLLLFLIGTRARCLLASWWVSVWVGAFFNSLLFIFFSKWNQLSYLPCLHNSYCLPNVNTFETNTHARTVKLYRWRRRRRRLLQKKIKLTFNIHPLNIGSVSHVWCVWHKLPPLTS